MRYSIINNNKCNNINNSIKSITLLLILIEYNINANAIHGNVSMIRSIIISIVLYHK